MLFLCTPHFPVLCQDQEIPPQHQLGCSSWVMNEISFNKTIDSLKSTSIAIQLIDYLYHIKNEKLIETQISENGISFVKLVLDHILKDAQNALLITKYATLHVTDLGNSNRSNLSPSFNCDRNIISVDVVLVRKLLLISLERSISLINSFENVVVEGKGYESFTFLNLWSEGYLKGLETKSEWFRLQTLRLFNRIAYFTFSEFYRFFLFTFSHEVYHLISNCANSEDSPKHELRADLLGTVTIQLLYRFINYDPEQLTKCIFGEAKIKEYDQKALLEFLYGAEVEYIIELLYADTYMSDGGPNYLTIADRKDFVNKHINRVHINKIYKQYEGQIRRFNKK